MTTSELTVLRNKLPRGSQKKIQKLTGFSRSFISNVLNGKANSPVIIQTANELAKEKEEKDNYYKAVYNRIANNVFN